MCIPKDVCQVSQVMATSYAFSQPIVLLLAHSACPRQGTALLRMTNYLQK